jgi:hypothetical protein
MIKQKFIKPTSKEVYDNMVEKQFEYAETESQKFIDYYESKNWKIVTTPMKDWDKAVSIWIINYYTNTKIITTKKSKTEIIKESLESNKYSDLNQIYEQ